MNLLLYFVAGVLVIEDLNLATCLTFITYLQLMFLPTALLMVTGELKVAVKDLVCPSLGLVLEQTWGFMRHWCLELQIGKNDPPPPFV